MLSAYPACFIKEEGGYSVIFPDLNHLATCGRTLDEAQNMAVDCLAGYLFWLQEDGEPIPPPSPADKIHLAEIVGETESSDAFVDVVTVDVAEYAETYFGKSVKKVLTIPAWKNTAALEQDINFSQVLQDALQSQLQRRPPAFSG